MAIQTVLPKGHNQTGSTTTYPVQLQANNKKGSPGIFHGKFRTNLRRKPKNVPRLKLSLIKILLVSENLIAD